MCDHESHQNRSQAQGFLIDKLSTAVLELADCRNTERTSSTIGKIQTPLMRDWIVEA
jgi:hypothetical protein